jgi:hypothetical protein
LAASVPATQRATFIITGLLMLALTLGLQRALRPRGGSRWGTVLLAAFAVGLIGAGLFLADPLSGYPPGSPGRPLQPACPASSMTCSESPCSSAYP